MRQNKRYFLLLTISLLPFIGHSAANVCPEILACQSLTKQNSQKTEADTVRLDELIVTGTMPRVNLRSVPMSVSVVSRQAIEQRLEPSLLPMLTEEVPGLFITARGVMGYGVASGSAGGMSIRGIGGSPTTGVLILIDGHPQYMGLMGHPLADSYRSLTAERVEVVRGPASVLYGSNAMGGVVNIITRKQDKEGWQGSGQLMYGSHNTLSTEMEGGWKKRKLQLTAAIGHSRSDGHRDNMDFEQWNGYTKFHYDFSTHWKGFVDLNISTTRSSNPGTETAPITDNDADITRGVSSLAVENNYGRTSGAVKVYYNFGRHFINDGYLDGESPKDYRFRSSDRMSGITLYQTYSFFEGNATTVGVDYQQYGGKAENKYLETNEIVLLVDTSLYNLAGYLNIQQRLPGDKITLNGGIRLDHHPVNGSEWVPEMGITYSPTTSTVFKAIVGKGYRNPTLRELFMFTPQNPELKAEEIMNYEISLLHSFPGDRFHFGVNLFYIKGENLIQTVIYDGRPLNKNTGKIENKGIELSAGYRASTNLSFSANYSYLDMAQKLIAAPGHKLYLGGNFAHGKWLFASGLQYIGNLYTTLDPEPEKENFLLWNLRAHYHISEIISLFVKGENLLGQRYKINAGYPMPGTTLFGGLKVRL